VAIQPAVLALAVSAGPSASVAGAVQNLPGVFVQLSSGHLIGSALHAHQDAPPAETKPAVPDAQEKAAPKETPSPEEGAGGAPKAREVPEDLLRGPKVPELDVKSDRPYVEGAKEGEKLSKPVLEQRAYFRTIDLFGFDASTKEKVDAMCVAFVDRVATFQKTAQKRRSELEAKRKLADPKSPPSEEFKREMNAIEAARPKLSELQAQVNTLIGADRGRELDRKFAEELKRVRDEQTRRTEEERKRRRAEIEEAKKARQSGGESGGEDEMAPSGPKR
jgi:hypothetical protein